MILDKNLIQARAELTLLGKQLKNSNQNQIQISKISLSDNQIDYSLIDPLSLQNPLSNLEVVDIGYDSGIGSKLTVSNFGSNPLNNNIIQIYDVLDYNTLLTGSEIFDINNYNNMLNNNQIILQKTNQNQSKGIIFALDTS